MIDPTLTSNERCPDCGREKWQHTPVEDFPCGVRISKELSLIQRLKNLGQGGFDLDFDALDQVTPEARRQCMEAELLANEAACALEESHRLFGALTGTGPAHETYDGHTQEVRTSNDRPVPPLYGGKVRLACGCIDICTNQRDHLGWSKPPSEKAGAGE